MSYPSFYDTVESIQVVDPLSNALGVFSDGFYEFNYIDVVKSAGHSCPTVAGAYIITLTALKFLYPEQRAERGNIRVSFEEDLEDGVTGVIANVVSQITGATDKSGFKGLQGKFSRHSLMHFNEDITSSARFTRIDTNKSVAITYNPSSILPNPNMQVIMTKMAAGAVTKEEVKEFGVLWQDRVERIFKNLDEVVWVEEV
ncbi:hypothetical protein JHD48_09380 [Sulfurimonas sp. SAG-AH-194-I05]|nr:FmdE family protein [Sulfurimonas sp. SAG-AH-194-I05]MDF1875945.1 hypothetical protein [Sulfurimonas sp. SAG-AH-194-I05]